MKALWLQLAGRYDALQLRERRLVGVALLGGIVLIGYALFVEPAMRREQLAERGAAEYRTQLAAVQAQMAVLSSPSQNPDFAAQAELAKLNQQLAGLASRLQVMEGSLVPPQRMTALLEDMIGQRTGLRLLSLKTLPVAPLLDRKDDAGKPAATPPAQGDEVSNPRAGLFRHGVEIRLQGSYQELAAYLQRLEKSDLKLLWSSVALSAEKHPKLELTLTVYTLSLDRTWLIV
jgi:MSHA biogenesis protein MshJ